MGPVVLPAALRMRASAEFSDTVAHGSRVRVGPVVTHLALPASAIGAPSSTHVGLVVSRAVGNAVVRHRVSRRLRHLMAQRTAALPPGSRLVVRALPSAATAPSSTLAAALDQALARSSREQRGPVSESAGRR